DYILGLATIMQYWYPNELIQHEIEEILDQRETFKYKKMFNTLGIGMLLFFLSALLISYVAQGYFADKNAEFNHQLSNLNETYDQVKKLQEEKDSKQAVLNESGILSQSFLSRYIHEIGATVPKSISLKGIELNPMQNQMKQDDKIEMHVNRILVSGEANSTGMLNYWIKELKKKSWVQKVSIKFDRNRKQVGIFTVTIEYK
ncbi:MAG: hypothetical protein HRT68_13320, partial [Flavobacteriaceae bacterium]|nr:hypothetical protein [Flavobacteriaceae bacterium]